MDTKGVVGRGHHQKEGWGQCAQKMTGVPQTKNRGDGLQKKGANASRREVISFGLRTRQKRSVETERASRDPEKKRSSVTWTYVYTLRGRLRDHRRQNQLLTK